MSPTPGGADADPAMHRAFGVVCLLVAGVTGLFLPGVPSGARVFVAGYPLVCAVAGVLMLSGRPRLRTVFLAAALVLLPALAGLTAAMILTALGTGFSAANVMLAALPMVVAWAAAVRCWSAGAPDAALSVLHMRFEPRTAAVLRQPGASALPRGIGWYAVVFVLPALVPQALALRVTVGLLAPPVIAAAAAVLGALAAAGLSMRRFERAEGRIVVLAP